MKILSIANSFGQDAQRWLRPLATGAGEDITCVNLYIGGCSLERHWNNMKADAAEYSYELNGTATGRMVSIREALEEGGWEHLLGLIQAQIEKYYEDGAAAPEVQP